MSVVINTAPLKRYEEELAKRYSLPSTRCIYTPDVYWRLDKVEKDTLQKLRNR